MCSMAAAYQSTMRDESFGWQSENVVSPQSTGMTHSRQREMRSVQTQKLTELKSEMLRIQCKLGGGEFDTLS